MPKTKWTSVIGSSDVRPSGSNNRRFGIDIRQACRKLGAQVVESVVALDYLLGSKMVQCQSGAFEC